MSEYKLKVNMGKEEIRYLLNKYITSTDNRADRIRLAELIAKMTNEELSIEIEHVWENLEVLERLSDDRASVILHNILSESDNSAKMKNKRKISFVKITSIAACFLLIIGLAFGIKSTIHNSVPHPVLYQAVEVASNIPTTYTRNMVLPDGSKIILRAGSTLEYSFCVRDSFRTVVLNGEAYFDVTHDPHHPFVIHTGKLKTTVLGTAFNIRAWNEQDDMEISVTRGKVKVEDQKTIIGVLTKNQILEYKSIEEKVNKHSTPPENVSVDWTKQDLNFDHATLAEIAQVLCKRFGVNIEITDSQLAQSEIVSTFCGTETLEEIMDVLCAINSQTHYTIKDKTIIISKY